MENKDTAKTFIYAGFFLFFSITILNFLKIEPAHNLYYLFAWWSYIFFIDGIIYTIRNESLIISRTKQFFRLLPWSAFIWFVFELINLRLQNWHYLYIPSSDYLRWSGYILSYATVLPAIFETAELLETLGLFKKSKIKPVKIAPKFLNGLMATGLAFILLPILFPKYFFSLIWGGFIFLLEPINYRLGLNSFLKDRAQGNIKKFYTILLSGLICGILWEFWNFWSGAKWEYTVPFVGNLKIFEMPILGYLGFPPFAISCYVMYSFISYIWRGKNHEFEALENLKIHNNPLLIIGAYILLIILSAATIAAIDKYTVWLYIMYL
ncbi:MAG: hypothetical protein L6420_06400 [Elusimicrobia bacterium]|nr:hypothetical protein [Elusimicrobiota bacterium]